MKNFKSEKGAITIIVLVSVLFFVSFLISSYVIVANKVQAQKEIVQQTRDIYENYNIKDSYNHTIEELNYFLESKPEYQKLNLSFFDDFKVELFINRCTQDMLCVLLEVRD